MAQSSASGGQSSDYVQLREGPVPDQQEPVEYVAVSEDKYGYTEMQKTHVKKPSTGEPPNVFVPLHQRQASRGSRHSSENGRFDMPEYMNAAKEGGKTDATTSASDLLLRNGVTGVVSSLNPSYGNLPSGGMYSVPTSTSAVPVQVQGALTVDDLPPPPPPNVTEEVELPFYAGVNKPPQQQQQQCPAGTPVAAVNKKEKKSADSVLYTQQSIPNKSSGGSSISTDSSHIEDVHQRKQFVRTLFCLLFVLFLMSAASIGLCVYLLLNWPSDCSACTTSAPAIVATPPRVQIATAVVVPDPLAAFPTTTAGPTEHPHNETLGRLAMEGVMALQSRLLNLENMVVPMADYNAAMAVINSEIDETKSVLASHDTSLSRITVYQNHTEHSLDDLSASVKDVHENFTDVSRVFEKTLRESRVFKNCSTRDRGCGGMHRVRAGDLVATCSGVGVRVPTGMELLSVKCMAGHSSVVAVLENSIGSSGEELYSCTCHVPQALQPATPLTSNQGRCVLRMTFCRLAQLVPSSQPAR